MQSGVDLKSGHRSSRHTAVRRPAQTSSLITKSHQLTRQNPIIRSQSLALWCQPNSDASSTRIGCHLGTSAKSSSSSNFSGSIFRNIIATFESQGLMACADQLAFMTPGKKGTPGRRPAKGGAVNSIIALSIQAQANSFKRSNEHDLAT